MVPCSALPSKSRQLADFAATRLLIIMVQMAACGLVESHHTHSLERPSPKKGRLLIWFKQIEIEWLDHFDYDG